MATRTRKAEAQLLDDRINILSRCVVGASPADQVFTTVNSILALVRDKMIDDRDSLQLSEYCFNVCGAVKTAIQGMNAGDLSESVRMALALRDLERVMCEIERTLRRGANMPHFARNKTKVEGHKLEIQDILSTFNELRSPLHENPRVDKCPPKLAPFGPYSATTSGTPFAHRFCTNFLGLDTLACGRLIRRAFTPRELPVLIEGIFSNKDERDTIRCLLKDDAQAFVDVIDEALDNLDFPPRIRKKCLKSLYKTCGRHALLPSAMKVTVWYDRIDAALYRGGFADVWKGVYCGRDVAVKVIRTYSNSDLQKIVGRYCKEVVTWKTLRHPNVLPLIGVTTSETQFAMVSDWMVNGNINDFVKARPDANRLELLGDVAKGLIYIHSRGMIHGDLKGANILIDQTGHARLADFGLLTFVSDPTNLLSSSSYTQGGTARWMSPELIAPERFGFEISRPTKASDCYALGMVIYETVSGKLPFHKYTYPTVILKVLEGERPARGVGFAGGLWKMLGQCWSSLPKNRPTIEDVLHCLEMPSNLLEPPPPPGADKGDWDSASSCSDIQNRTSCTMTTKGSTTMSFGSSRRTNRPLNEADINRLGRDVTDPDLTIPWIDSGDGDNTYQDLLTVPEVVKVTESHGSDVWGPRVPVFHTRAVDLGEVIEDFSLF